MPGLTAGVSGDAVRVGQSDRGGPLTQKERPLARSRSVIVASLWAMLLRQVQVCWSVGEDAGFDDVAAKGELVHDELRAGGVGEHHPPERTGVALMTHS